VKSKSGWWQRCLLTPLIFLASLLMWIEETLWAWLQWLTAKIAILSWIRRLEASIRKLPPYATVVVFFLPLTILLPFKLVAVYWLSKGYWFRSLAVIIAAKILGTAIEARMFVICRPQLMAIPWFRSLHDSLLRFRDRLRAALHASPAYQFARAQLNSMKLAAREFLSSVRSRWRAVRTWYQNHRRG